MRKPDEATLPGTQDAYPNRVAKLAEWVRMQILFCNYEYPPIGGGGGVVMAAMAAELARRGHDITVLTSRAFGLPADSMEDGVREGYERLDELLAR